MFERIRDTVREVLEAAELASGQAGLEEVGGVSILRELLLQLDDEARMFLGRLGTSAAALETALPPARQAGEVKSTGGLGNKAARFNQIGKKILMFAYEEADRCGDRGVGTSELLIALVRAGGPAADALKGCGVELDRARKALEEMRQGEGLSPLQIQAIEARLSTALERMEVRIQRLEETQERFIQVLPERIIFVLGEKGFFKDYSESAKLNLRHRVAQEVKRILRVG